MPRRLACTTLPVPDHDAALLLAQPGNDAQRPLVGGQGAGRVCHRSPAR